MSVPKVIVLFKSYFRSFHSLCKFGRIRNDVKKSAINFTNIIGAALAKRLPAPYKLYYPDCLVRNSA
ncbi:uncharacterized protein OCT59_013841 [Rhizophagus irregularis]|uniref:uncharacterized protein n=1 Tax=Rhizophagus irregularis TaxID=588596 RepID=UPI0033320934|nr:hypothetical protein OCT59_013841 [Rhizophagus irregularis]